MMESKNQKLEKTVRKMYSFAVNTPFGKFETKSKQDLKTCIVYLWFIDSKLDLAADKILCSDVLSSKQDKNHGFTYCSWSTKSLEKTDFAYFSNLAHNKHTLTGIAYNADAYICFPVNEKVSL